MPSLELISFDLCPFVQRSAIALQEKGVAYDITYIDLQDKPDWFLEISPHGKVPVLKVDGDVLFESVAILEYLDETQDPPLHPRDPLQKARDRAWFSVSDNLNGAAYHMMVAADQDAFDAAVKATRAELSKLESEIAGPLWRGESFCAMDAVIYPGLQRVVWMAELYPDQGFFDGLPAVATWERTLSQRPSIVASTVDDIKERFTSAIKQYAPFHRDALG